MLQGVVKNHVSLQNQEHFCSISLWTFIDGNIAGTILMLLQPLNPTGTNTKDEQSSLSQPIPSLSSPRRLCCAFSTADGRPVAHIIATDHQSRSKSSRLKTMCSFSKYKTGRLLQRTERRYGVHEPGGNAVADQHKHHEFFSFLHLNPTVRYWIGVHLRTVHQRHIPPMINIPVHDKNC